MDPHNFCCEDVASKLAAAEAELAKLKKQPISIHIDAIIDERMLEFREKLVARASALAKIRGSNEVEERDVNLAVNRLAEEELRRTQYGKDGLPISRVWELHLTRDVAAAYLRELSENESKEGRKNLLKGIASVLIGILENEASPSP